MCKNSEKHSNILDKLELLCFKIMCESELRRRPVFPSERPVSFLDDLKCNEDDLKILPDELTGLSQPNNPGVSSNQP